MKEDHPQRTHGNLLGFSVSAIANAKRGLAN
jgi:hypothetical protein